MLVAPAAQAGRHSIGANGVIVACYKGKGKGKGTVRLVKSKKQCRHKKRHEKSITWNVAGQAGTNGSNGAVDVSDLVSRIDTLETQVDALTTQLSSVTSQLTTLQDTVAGLGGILGGVTNADLTSAISKLNGISGTDLQTAVDGVPGLQAALTSACAQLTVVTEQANGIRDAVNGVAGVLGLPGDLSPYSCPAF